MDSTLKFPPLGIDPILILEELAEKLVTSAESLFSANSKESFVLVEFSKKRLTIFLPFNSGTFLIGRSNISLNKMQIQNYFQ